MKKIRLIQNAATFVSDLKVDEIEVLQKQNPMALAIVEPNQDGGTDVVFSVQYKNTAFGEINENRVLFVDRDAEGFACMTVLIPANSGDKAGYLFDKYATPVNLLKAVEKKAKNALKHLTTSKEKFAEEFINLDTEITVAEALEEVDVIVKAEPAEEINVEKEGK